ncbi:MAG TPA: MATE family efflux transporter, partial [Leptolyngbyaceae cyanobacterium]
MSHLLTRPTVRTEIREFLRLMVPLSSAHVAQAATGFVDTVMMGWLGQTELAAGGLAAMTFTTFLITTTGIITGISPLVAEAFGAGHHPRIQQLARQGLWLALLIALPVMLLLGHFDSVMRHLGQSELTLTTAQSYLDVMVWGFLPALAFAVLRNVVSALSQPRPVMVIVIAGTVLNGVGNYLFGFGHLGLPALGLPGIALSSALCNWLMLACLLIYIFKHPELKTYRLFHGWRLEPLVLRELVWLGLPIGVSFALEVGLFTITTYLMGALGTEVLAAHQIVFQTIAVIFMVPLGMSDATTIRVGQWNGRQDPSGVRRAAYVGMGLGGSFMTLMALVLLLFPQGAIALFLDIQNPDNAQVISLAISMFGIAALSQILDGVQTTAAGALRGLKDTRIPMVLSLLAFWGMGLGS